MLHTESFRYPVLRLSLSGAGFLGAWHLGVGRVLQRAGILHRCEIAGASGGALVGAVLATGTPLSQAQSALAALVAETRAAPLGICTPRFSLVERVREHLLAHLPSDAHQQASGRLHVALTSLRRGEVGQVYHKVSFGTRDELIDAVVASSDIPGVTGLLRTAMPPQSYSSSPTLPQTLTRRLDVDGGLLDLFPDPWGPSFEVCFSSPFAGRGLNISPSVPGRETRVLPQWPYRGGRSVDISLQNAKRMAHALAPPRDEACYLRYEVEAFDRAVEWLQERGLCGGEGAAG